jgi:hypothetical protein
VGDEGGGGDEGTVEETTTTTATTIPVVADAQNSRSAGVVAGLTEVGVTVEKFGNKYSIVVTSPVRNSIVQVKATAKGKQTITWSTKTNVNAQKIIMSTRPLKGYTISMWVNGRRLSSIKAG